MPDALSLLIAMARTPTRSCIGSGGRLGWGARGPHWCVVCRWRLESSISAFCLDLAPALES
eukprot:COSAG01_NODE_27_length_36706_cov_155.674106_20_plen_61_part_00